MNQSKLFQVMFRLRFALAFCHTFGISMAAEVASSSFADLDPQQTSQRGTWTKSGVLKNTRPCTKLLFSADNKSLIFGCSTHSGHPGEIRLYNLQNGVCLNPIGTFRGDARQIALSSSGDVLASVQAGSISAFNVSSRSEIANFPLHAIDRINGQLDFAPNDDSLLVGGYPAIVWKDPLTATRTRETQDDIHQYALTSDGTIVVERDYRQITLRDRMTRKVRHIVPVKRAYQCKISPDGLTLAVLAHHSVTLWNLSSGAQEHDLPVGRDPLNSINFSPRGHLLATAGRGAIRMWDTRSGALHARIVAEEEVYDNYRGAVFSHDGRWLAAIGGNDVIVWSQAGLKAFAPPIPKTLVASSVRELPIFYKNVVGAAPLGGRQWIGLGSNSDGIMLFNDVDNMYSSLGAKKTVRDLVASNSGSFVAASDGYQLRIYQVPKRKLMATFVSSDKLESSKGRFYNRKIAGYDLSPDGSLVAVGWEGGKVELISINNSARREVDSLPGTIQGLTISPTGRQLALIENLQVRDSRKTESHIKVYDLPTLKLNKRVLQSRNVGNIKFSKNGRTLAASDGSAVHLWDVETGVRLGLYTSDRKSIHDYSLSPDGTRIALSIYNGPIEIHLLASGVCSERVSRDKMRRDCLLWSKNSRSLVSVSNNGITRWSLGE